MKFGVDGPTGTFDLTLEPAGNSVNYTVGGDIAASASASIVIVRPGVYSVLLGTGSFTVFLSQTGGQYEATVAGRRTFLTIADKRDRPEKQRVDVNSGAVDVRAQMPGKIISLLVAPGTEVAAGQSLLVIEAMKMQNELKSPKAGTVSKILVSEGDTVPANHKLVVIE